MADSSLPGGEEGLAAQQDPATIQPDPSQIRADPDAIRQAAEASARSAEQMRRYEQVAGTSEEAARAREAATRLQQESDRNAEAYRRITEDLPEGSAPSAQQIFTQIQLLTQAHEHLRQQSDQAYRNLDQRVNQAGGIAQQAAAAPARNSPVQIRIPQPQRFKGVREGPKILEWAHQATTYLRAAKIADTVDGVWHISNFLDGDAAVWWRLQCDKYERGLAIMPTNWLEMKFLLVSQFQVFNHETDVKDRYTALRQQTTVSAYITRFRALVVELPEETEANQVYQFLKGLKPEIQARTRTHKPKTLMEAMDIADEADRANYHAYKGASNRSSASGARTRFGGGGGTGVQPMQIGAVATAPSPEDIQRL